MQQRYLSICPLLSLHSFTLESNFADCLKSLSRSLMIHATVFGSRWPCGWVKNVQSVNRTHEKNNNLSFWKLRDVVVQQNFKRNLHCLLASTSFGTSVSNMGACTCRTGWEGYTVETMLNSFGAERQLTSLWSRSVILRHVPYTCYTEQQIVQNRSQQLPPKHPFQQLRMSCTGLQLAIPAFAHRDTCWKITQSVDSGLLWDVWIRAAYPCSTSRQKNHFECWMQERYLSICSLLSLHSCAHLYVSFTDCLNPIERLLDNHATCG